MPKPYACPHGRCTYCPGGIEFNSPNSYTGNEPSTLNAIENEYDPKLQITTKIEEERFCLCQEIIRKISLNHVMMH
jgi:elongator complex protein 3